MSVFYLYNNIDDSLTLVSEDSFQSVFLKFNKHIKTYNINPVDSSLNSTVKTFISVYTCRGFFIGLKVVFI